MIEIEAKKYYYASFRDGVEGTVKAGSLTDGDFTIEVDKDILNELLIMKKLQQKEYDEIIENNCRMRIKVDPHLIIINSELRTNPNVWVFSDFKGNAMKEGTLASGITHHDYINSLKKDNEFLKMRVMELEHDLAEAMGDMGRFIKRVHAEQEPIRKATQEAMRISQQARFKYTRPKRKGE